MDLGRVGSTYPVCNGDDSVSGFSFQLLETKGRKKTSFTLSPKQAHHLAGVLECLTQSQGGSRTHRLAWGQALGEGTGLQPPLLTPRESEDLVGASLLDATRGLMKRP